MECSHAYLKKDIDYVLCDKEPEPSRYNRVQLFHAVCAHQVECPREHCHKLSGSWVNCVKLDMRPPVEEPEEEIKPKRTRKKST